MTVVHLTENSLFINSTANVIPLANTYGANATAGATCLYLFNSNTAVQTITLANTQGSFTFTIPPSTAIILNKNASDTLASYCRVEFEFFHHEKKFLMSPDKNTGKSPQKCG
jgi:hypothetical protein